MKMTLNQNFIVVAKRRRWVIDRKGKEQNKRSRMQKLKAYIYEYFAVRDAWDGYTLHIGEIIWCCFIINNSNEVKPTVGLSSLLWFMERKRELVKDSCKEDY